MKFLGWGYASENGRLRIGRAYHLILLENALNTSQKHAQRRTNMRNTPNEAHLTSDQLPGGLARGSVWAPTAPRSRCWRTRGKAPVCVRTRVLKPAVSWARCGQDRMPWPDYRQLSISRGCWSPRRRFWWSLRRTGVWSRGKAASESQEETKTADR